MTYWMGGELLVVLSIYGTCTKCSSEGSIHLIIKKNGEYEWVCTKCVESPEHALRPITVVN